MAGAESKRFYLALAVWTCAFLAGAALAYAGVLGASPEAMAFSFVMGLAAIFVFFRPAGG
jgi:hypothetical protein